MDINKDYFPPLLPATSPSSTMDVVGIMDLEEDEAFKQFTNDNADDGAEIYFGLPEDLSTGHRMSDSPALQSCSLTNLDDASHELGFEPRFSTSPESSQKDSSSDFSTQHLRGSSSNSSGSGLHGAEIPVANDQTASWNKGQTISGPGLNESLFGDLQTSETLDSRKTTPEHDFDFRCKSNASTGIGSSDSISFSPLLHTNMPYRSSPTPSHMARRGRSHRAGASSGSNGVSPLSPASQSLVSGPIKQLNPYLATHKWPGAQNEDAMFEGIIQQPVDRLDAQPGNQNSSENASSTFYSAAPSMPAAISMPAASAINTSTFRDIGYMMSNLWIHQKHDKSRVETQIPIKLILYPMPVGITKLHLPPHTLSKPKQLADRSLSRSPDTLELDCMLVCTSAMQDGAKRQAAFARAADQKWPIDDIWGSRSNNGSLSADRELKPCDGGVVRICTTCITREEKRAGRKKAKIEDRAELWQKLAEDRVVIFNSNEVIEWQEPSERKPARKSADLSATSVGSPDDNLPNIPSGAMQVDLPMRIACYCRHQDERFGFQVIFTLRNHQGRCVAQSMTNSITITDDHKTSATPLSASSQNQFYPENMQFPGAGVFPQESPNHYMEGSMRQAQSFPNLQAIQNQRSFQTQPSLQLLPYTTSHISSPNTPLSMTPYTLSRPVSPSAPSGPCQKKRKPSGSGKASKELAMTKLHPQDSSSISVSGPIAPGSLIGLTSSTTLANSNTYGSSNAFIGQHQGGPTTPTLSRYNTNPPTPIRSETSWPSPSPRSQSMENISLGLQMPRTSPDLMNISYTNSSNLPHNHLDSLASSIHEDLPGNPSQQMLSGHQAHERFLQEPTNPLSLPMISKIAPVTGPIAGGIEVICLGAGFYQGLEIAFGDTIATTKSYLGESCLICILPPTTQPTTVSVHCNHDYQGIVPWSPIQQIFFTYVDDNELQLLRLALTTLNHRITGRKEDARKIARDTINGHHLGRSCQDDNGGQPRLQHHQVSGSVTALTTSVDFEASLLGCLDIMDLDDSLNQPRLNSRGPNGQSMLHYSASLGYYRFAAALLARGANPDIRDQNGMSPMHMASLNDHPNLIRKLRSAGGDPTLRSLRGLTPADMASSNDVRDVFDILENFSLPRGFGLIPTSRQSRASSTSSSQPFWRARSMSGSVEVEGDLSDDPMAAVSDQEKDDLSPHSLIVTPAQSWARSRRNSINADSSFLNSPLPVDRVGSDGFLAAATAWSVWRDQLIAQVQMLQQTVHRTLPALQIPTLPPIPNLPDYQAYPVVRRISSLVPQRYPRALTPDLKENDYHWWELLRGTTAPPAYEELYPTKEQKRTMAIGQDSTKTPSGETLAITKCSTASEQNGLPPASILETIKIDSASLTLKQREELMAAHAIKVKRLRSDRKLFFFWIPLLVFVLVAMLKDRVIQFWNIMNSVLPYLQDAFRRHPTTTT